MAKKQERKMIDASGILDQIIASTFTRHAYLSEEDFVKEIGLEGAEDTATIKARFSLICESTKELLKAVDKIKLINETLKIGLGQKENE